MHSATQLSADNYRLVRTNVVGRSRGFKLLGMFTLYPATHTKALTRLYAEAGVEEGRPQALAHVVAEPSVINLILFTIPTVTVRADLVEFLEGPSAGNPLP